MEKKQLLTREEFTKYNGFMSKAIKKVRVHLRFNYLVILSKLGSGCFEANKILKGLGN